MSYWFLVLQIYIATYIMLN